LQSILGTARQIDDSVTHRLFQELVLGSSIFVQSYGLPALMETESYLLHFDIPTLSPSDRERLILWLEDGDHQASIFTSRPSRPVGDQVGTPEAEIGAQSVGLEDLPIIGLGGLMWLADRRSREPDAFRKPSPVHALAAMRAALGHPLQEALQAAAALVLDKREDGGWDELSGAEVYVFEDTAGGLLSALGAQKMLELQGVEVKFHLFGITNSEPKRHALRETGATVTPSLSAALLYLPGF
jgi:hypothetical protein